MDLPVGALETTTFLSGLEEAFLLLVDLIISLVMAINELETLVDSLAEVSKNCIPYWAAKSFPCSTVTFLSLSISHLFPTNIL